MADDDLNFDFEGTLETTNLLTHKDVVGGGITACSCTFHSAWAAYAPPTCMKACLPTCVHVGAQKAQCACATGRATPYLGLLRMRATRMPMPASTPGHWRFE